MTDPHPPIRWLHARQRLVAFCFVLLLVASGAGAQVPVPGQGSTRNRLPEPRIEEEKAPLPVFEFHSGFWINLHHFLYQQAREEQASRAAPPAEGSQDWAAALDYYARELADRDLLFNGDMINIKNRLAEMEGCPDLSGQSDPQCASGLRPGLIAALEQAAPVYRARWWADHDRTNRAWAKAVSPLVERLGVALAERLAAAYREQWPAERMRVDVSYVANWAGAYTTLRPTRITIASGDPRNEGIAALETLFHEASHALAEAVRDGIARECRRRNKPIPRDLWHALLFYTTGEMVRRALTGLGGPLARDGYTPYAVRQGLYARGWEGYLRVLERHWQPYLDGKLEFDRAVARMVAAL